MSSLLTSFVSRDANKDKILTMSRSVRFFDIIQILRQARKPVTAQELAERLECSTRTIYRDVAALQASGVQVIGEAGIGYELRKGADLPPLNFDFEEIEAITVGLALIARTRDSGLQKAADRVTAKITEVLPVDHTLDAPLHVSDWTGTPESTTSAEKLRAFIRDECELKIEYYDLAGDFTTRRIYPLILTYYINSVLLTAWCHLRNDFRQFRIDQIQNCQSTKQGFKGKGDILRKQWYALNRE